MAKSKNKLYEPEKIANFQELVKRYSLFSDKVAFEYKIQPKDKEIIKITYKQFQNDIYNLGTALLSLGLEGKNVAIIGSNRYEWCTSYLAVEIANMIAVPLDKALPDGEIESLIIRSKAEAVIFDVKYLDVFQKIKKENSSSLKYFICMDFKEDSKEIYSYTRLLQSGR